MSTTLKLQKDDYNDDDMDMDEKMMKNMNMYKKMQMPF